VPRVRRAAFHPLGVAGPALAFTLATFGIVAAAPPSAPTPRADRPPPAVVRTLIDGAGPLGWNRAIESDASLAHTVPRWPAVRVCDPLGSESLYVFHSRAASPSLIAAWPRVERGRHAIRIAPDYHWLLVERPDSLASAEALLGPGPGWRIVRVHAANGSLLATLRAYGPPSPIGRDFVLWPIGTPAGAETTSLCVRRLPSGENRECWLAGAGHGASAPLENFLAVNLAAYLDQATGIRQDLLRLLDLDGGVIWSRPVTADYREFSVSNFGDVAIAREGSLRVFDRSGAVRFEAPLTLNVVGRTAMGSDGRFVLVATSTPGGPRGPDQTRVSLYDTRRKTTPVWSRRDFAERHGGEILELSVSDDGAQSLLRFSTGAVSLLGRDGARVAGWDLPRVASGEYQRGVVPRRTWLSSDGSLVALTMPVAPSLAVARGSLFQVPRGR
jgi:hypothetical protein